MTLQTKDFDFHLPENLIAKNPTINRDNSRLLVVNSKNHTIEHKHFYDFIDYLDKDDLLVFNNTKVLNARLFGKKETGGKVEILIERILDNKTVLAHLKTSRKLVENSVIYFENYQAVFLRRENDLFVLQWMNDIYEILETIGKIPLPPYIDRNQELTDKERYQTVYAQNLGAVAAPTAGLHFTDEILEKIKAKGCKIAFITLHIGAGTFRPVKVDNILEHKMHSEIIHLDEQTANLINDHKQQGGKVVAIGTTSVRVLESCANEKGLLQAFTGETDIFLYPGKQFKIVDKLLTNFHLPQSTLLMLVAAFTGFENAMNAYKIAVEEEYRFFSYGDCMFIENKI